MTPQNYYNDPNNVGGKNLGFIVGHYKSGSTWLSNLLSIHPDVIGVGETHVFRHAFKTSISNCNKIVFKDAYWGYGGIINYPKYWFAEKTIPIRKIWRQNLLDYTQRPRLVHDLGLLKQIQFRRFLLRSETPVEYCRRFYNFLYENYHPQGLLIEKTPNNIYEVENIKDIFPNSKLISIYRDGRDVAISERFFRKKLGLQPISIEESAFAWRDAMETQFKLSLKYGIHSIKYEDLLSDGLKTVGELLKSLTLNTDESIINTMIKKSSFKFITGRKSGDENRISFYRKGISGDWKNYFSDDEKKIFKKIAGDVLLKLQYEKDNNW